MADWIFDPTRLRIGQRYDVHALAEGCRFVGVAVLGNVVGSDNSKVGEVL